MPTPWSAWGRGERETRHCSSAPLGLVAREEHPRGTAGPGSRAHLVQTGDETRGRAGEPEALLDGGEAALEVGTVQELGELQEAMAEHEHLLGRRWELRPVLQEPPLPGANSRGTWLLTQASQGAPEGEMPSLLPVCHAPTRSTPKMPTFLSSLHSYCC